MDDKLTFSYQARRDDFVKGIRAYQLRRSNWIGVGFFLVIPPLCLLSLVLVAVQNSFAYSVHNYLELWIFIPLLILFAAFFYLINPRMAANRFAKEERQTTETTWQVDREEINVSTKFGETRMDWGTFKEVVENKDYFILTLTAIPNMFQIIPKRAFQSSGDADQFRGYLTENNIHPPRMSRRPRFLIILFLILIAIISLVVWNFQQF